MADRAVHRCRPARQPGAGVARPIGGPAIGFGLHDSADDDCSVELARDQDAEQVARDGLGRSSEEAPVERFERRYTITA
jgi:hypothetical protein